jgi:hypothetical protein
MAKPKPKLFAPENYWRASQEVKDQVTNGCGTAGWKGRLVPDTMYFLNVSAACNIHDWMYTLGRTLADKEEADRVFLNNLYRIINAAGGCSLLVNARLTRARDYYDAVHYFGGDAFWDNKNAAANIQEAA